MSLLFQGIKGLGNIAYHTGSAVLQGGKGVAQTVVATPIAITNGTMAVVSTLVNSTFQVTTAIKNKTTSAVIGGVNKAKSTATAIKDKSVNIVKSAATGAVNLLSAGKDAFIAKSVLNYAELFFRIDTVGDKIVNDLETKQPVSQVNRNELAERLEEFVDIYTLTTEEKAFVISFCKDLSDVSIIFDETKLKEMGQLEKILNPHLANHKSYISSKIAERKQLEKLPGLTTVASPKLTKAETLTGIEDQAVLLKSNSIKMILSSIVLNMTLGVSTFEGIDFNALEIDCNALGIAPPNENTNLTNFLIEVSNKAKIEGKSSEEVFQDLMFRVIDNSDKNIFTRIQAKVRCWFVFGLVLNLVGNIFDNLKATLVHFASLPPAKQLEELTKLLINPLLEHLSTVDGSGPANQPAASTPKTADELLDQFIEAFLAQFIDRKYQPWTRTYRAICIERASRSEPITKVFYNTLAILLWVAGKFTAPIHWAINETIHGVLKTVIVELCPSLSNATKSSLELGTNNAWHSLKNSLLHLLQQIRLTSLLPRAKDPVYQLPKKLPDDVKEKLTTVLDKLFKVLAIPCESQTAAESKSTLSTLWSAVKLMARNGILQDADIAEEELRNFLATDGKSVTTLLQQNMHRELSGLKDIIKTALTGLILDMVAEDDFLNGTLLSSLTSINASGFAPRSAPAVPTEEKQRIEVELQKELGLLGGSILQAVNTATRTDRSYQKSANIHITALKQQVHAFNQTLLRIQQNKDLSFIKSGLKACEQFSKSMEKLEAEITKSVDEPTKALLMPHLNQALDHVRTISANLSQCPIEEKRKQVETKLNELYPLLANGEEIDNVIVELWALNSPFLDVESLVNDLNVYKTTALKAFPVADHKDRANRAAKAYIKQLNPAKIDPVNESAAQLAQWANGLQFVKVTTKPAAKDVGMTAVYNSPLVKAATGAALQSYGRNIFTFIGDEKNLAGIAQRGMEAFLSKPSMMPKKQRPKVGMLSLFSENTPQALPLSPKDLKKLTDKDWEVLSK